MPNNVPLPLDPFHDPDMPSMAEALSRFESMPDETPSRKARVRAAVATIGRLLRKSPAELSTQPTYLKQWFRHFKHRPTGLTSKSLANCKTTLPNWPQVTLFLPPARISRWTVDPQRFPASFRQDVDQWQDGLSKVDPEAEEGRIRPLRPESLRLHRHQVFKAASALVFSGQPIETVTSFACLVEFDAFKKILTHLRERQGGEPTTALLGLARTLKAIAKHKAQMSEQHLQRMARICANYAQELEGRVSKSRGRLQIFEDERLLAALLHMPGRLLDEARRAGTSPTKARLLAQVAIAIEIEWHAPLRLANLVSLNLQRNIQAVMVKGEVRWIIRFDRHETKNRSLLVYELPAAVVRQIKSAFGFYSQTNGQLFPGRKGSHKHTSLFGKQVKQEVERRLGVPFNIHLFRGLNATTQVKENVNGFEIGRAMLADRSDSVIRTYYTSTAERHLIADAQETIQRVKIRTAPLVDARSRKRAPN